MDVKLQEFLTFHEQFLKKEEEKRDLRSFVQPDREGILNAVSRHFDMSAVRAVMLFGSRADGRNEANSDVDLLLLLADGEENCLNEQQRDELKKSDRTHIGFRENGIGYSLQILPYSFFFGGEMRPRARYFYGMKPLFDPFGDGIEIAEKTLRFVHSVNESLPHPNDNYRNHIFDMLKRAQGNDLSAALTRNSILSESLPYLYAYNGYLFIGEKKAADILLRDAPNLADVFAAALLPNAGYDACAAWVEAAFSEPVSLNWESLDFSGSIKCFEKSVRTRFGHVCTLKQLLNRKNEVAIYAERLCEYLNAEWLDMAKLLTATKTKAPQIYEYLWSRIR